ncbi:serine/threonine protein kinase [Phytophthora nicotianae INRA-310]|uniref:Serine/threonine protein kinase n=1 Tax=Phytophthora nicotianae (strain INRA-310) TaxID=761204 RepID=W2PQ83_PHYN3|nr:serine/threonine protein kinase [Phytophthora nicotianae INRA-310]ETN02175.1 serine/threonine protein kinase [Phytophthora nicotianae INRA-310]
MQQWSDDVQALEAALAATVRDSAVVFSELQDSQSQVEALLTLKFELQQRGDSVDNLEMMIRTISMGSHVVVRSVPLWFLPRFELVIEAKPFACGPSGSMHHAVWGADTRVALKRFSAVDSMEIDGRKRQHIKAELDQLYQLTHPNLVKILGASHVSLPPFIVWEEEIYGGLGSFLSCSDENKWRLFYQAALGLDYIHKKGVVHGDLKLNNILVGSNGQAKLTDHGLATLRTVSKSLSRSLRWGAPECLKQRPTFASDVYSFAMCLIEPEAGEPPFKFLDDDDVRHNLRHGVTPTRPRSMNDDEWELVLAMTDSDPTKRVSLERVIAEMKRLAEQTAMAVQAAITCSACSSEVATDSWFCSQCGTEVNTASLRTNPQSLHVDIPVPELLEALRRGRISDQEQALVLLLEKCLDETQRKEIIETDGVDVLICAVETSSSHFVQICALSCLRWISVVDSRFSTGDLKALEEFVHDATSDECTSMMNDLRNGQEEEKLKAIVYCSGIAAAKTTQILANSSILALFVELLTKCNKRLTVWVVEAIGHLADNDDTRVVIANEGAIKPLIELLHSGSSAEKGLAAYTLGRLACDNEENSLAIEAGGAISYLAELLVANTNVEKMFAPYALTFLPASGISVDTGEYYRPSWAASRRQQRAEGTRSGYVELVL